jgi:hypothetical protein
MATQNTTKAGGNAGKGSVKPNKKDSGSTRRSSTADKTASGGSKSTSANKGAASETPGSTKRSK